MKEILLTSSVLIAALLVLRFFFRRSIPRRVQYALWALVALRLCPKAADYLFGSHISSEPAGRMIVEELGLLYFLDCGMHLGEGTGAVTSLALYDLAQNLYETMSTFEDYQMQAYQPLI